MILQVDKCAKYKRVGVYLQYGYFFEINQTLQADLESITNFAIFVLKYMYDFFKDFCKVRFKDFFVSDEACDKNKRENVNTSQSQTSFRESKHGVGWIK